MITEDTRNRLGARLRALREEASLSQTALAAALGFNDRQTVAAIEAGERRVAPAELVQIARVFEVEPSALVDPFRLLGEGSFSFRAGEVPPETIRAFEDRVGGWIATHRELGRQVGVEPRRISTRLELTPRSSYEEAAQAAEALVREWDLGSVPAERLQAAIEDRLGVLVLHVDAPEGISGAASRLPCHDTIVVNRNEPEGRRSFNLAHELFHLLTWDAMPPRRVESLEPPRGKGHRVEQLAENFAAALLMPSEVVRERWKRRGEEELGPWLGSTAEELRVSGQALRWRLINLKILSDAAPAAVRSRRDGRDRHPPLFSRALVARVAEAVEAGRLSVRRAASLLGLSTVELGELCASYGSPLSYEFTAC
jgi:XRE family transcriptional regulator, fatty acid utilization regulator